MRASSEDPVLLDISLIGSYVLTKTLGQRRARGAVVKSGKNHRTGVSVVALIVHQTCPWRCSLPPGSPDTSSPPLNSSDGRLDSPRLKADQVRQLRRWLPGLAAILPAMEVILAEGLLVVLFAEKSEEECGASSSVGAQLVEMLHSLDSLSEVASPTGTTPSPLSGPQTAGCSRVVAPACRPVKVGPELELPPAEVGFGISTSQTRDVMLAGPLSPATPGTPPSTGVSGQTHLENQVGNDRSDTTATRSGKIPKMGALGKTLQRFFR